MIPSNMQTRRGRQLIEWIAMNDDAAELDPGTIQGYTTVTMLSHVYNVPACQIAARISIIRKEESEARS